MRGQAAVELFRAAVSAVAPGRMRAAGRPRPPRAAGRRTPPPAEERAFRSGRELVRWVTSADPAAAALLASLTAGERNDVQLVLDGMLRARWVPVD